MSCCCCDPFQITYITAIITIIQAVVAGILNVLIIAINRCSIAPPDELPYEPARMIWAWYLFDNGTCADMGVSITTDHWIYEYADTPPNDLTSSDSNYGYQITYLILHLFWILTSIVLIYGNARRRCKFYYPWILNTFTILVMDIVVASFFISEIVDNWKNTEINEVFDKSKITLAIMGPVLFYLRGIAFWISNCVDAGNVIMAFCWARKKTKKRKELKEAKREAALANQRVEEVLRITQGGGGGGPLQAQPVPVQVHPMPPQPQLHSQSNYRPYANMPHPGGRYDQRESERDYFEGAEPPRPPPAPRELRPFSYLNPAFRPHDPHDIVGMKSHPAAEYENLAFEEDLQRAKEIVRKKSENLPPSPPPVYERQSKAGYGDRPGRNSRNPPPPDASQGPRTSSDYATPWNASPKRDPVSPVGEYHQHLHVTQTYPSGPPQDPVHHHFSRSSQLVQSPSPNYENVFNSYPEQIPKMTRNGMQPTQNADYIPNTNIYEKTSLSYPTRMRPSNHGTEVPRNQNSPQSFQGDNKNIAMANSNIIMGVKEIKTEDVGSAINKSNVLANKNRSLSSLPEGNSRKSGEGASLNELIRAVGDTNEVGKNVPSGYSDQSLGRSSVTGMTTGGVAVPSLRRDVTARLSKRLKKNRGRSENPRPQWEEQWQAMRRSRRKYGRVRALARPNQTAKQAQGTEELKNAQRQDAQHTQTAYKNSQENSERNESRPMHPQQAPHQSPQQTEIHTVDSQPERGHLSEVHYTHGSSNQQGLNIREGRERGYVEPETRDNNTSGQIHSAERGLLSRRQPMPRTNAWVHPRPQHPPHHHISTQAHQTLPSSPPELPPYPSTQAHQTLPSSPPELPPYPSTQAQTPFNPYDLPNPPNNTQPPQAFKPEQLPYPSTQAQTSFHSLDSSQTTRHTSNQAPQPWSSQSNQSLYPSTQAQASIPPYDPSLTPKHIPSSQTSPSHYSSREERDPLPSAGRLPPQPHSALYDFPPLPRRLAPGEVGPSVVREIGLRNQQEGVLGMHHTYHDGTRYEFGESSF